MELEEAIEILKKLDDGYTFKACDVCSNYNETTLRCDKEKCEELIAIETILAELDRLQKENEELKEEIEHLNEYIDYKTETYQEMLEDKQNYIDLLKEE